jgi:hypothetical protein
LIACVYGSSAKYHGKEVGFSADTGASVLAPARAERNRELDRWEQGKHPLHIGLGTAPNTMYRMNNFEQYGRQDARATTKPA